MRCRRYLAIALRITVGVIGRRLLGITVLRILLRLVVARLLGITILGVLLRVAVWIVAGLLVLLLRLRIAGILKLAHALTYAPEQLRNALGPEEEHQDEDDKDDRFWVA